MVAHMFRLYLVMLLILGLALPGLAVVPHGGQDQAASAHSGHGHHSHGHEIACESGECTVGVAMTCCAMLAGHCSSLAVPQNSDWTPSATGCGLERFSIPLGELRAGGILEMEPPPPRA